MGGIDWPGGEPVVNDVPTPYEVLADANESDGALASLAGLFEDEYNEYDLLAAQVLYGYQQTQALTRIAEALAGGVDDRPPLVGDEKDREVGPGRPVTGPGSPAAGGPQGGTSGGEGLPDVPGSGYWAQATDDTAIEVVSPMQESEAWGFEAGAIGIFGFDSPIEVGFRDLDTEKAPIELDPENDDPFHPPNGVGETKIHYRLPDENTSATSFKIVVWP